MKESEKVKKLINKYENVLTQSIKLTLAEDLVNLIIVNQEDKEFELIEFIKKKEAFKNFVYKHYFKTISNHPLKGLSSMNEPFKMKNK